MKELLVVVDVQNDFCPGGALAVPHGDEVIDVIHKIAPDFEHIVLTQDWHPAGHSSFAALWPPHCIQGTPGAGFHPRLHLPQAELIIRKGFRPETDSYSAFFENDHKTPTGLTGYLQERGIHRIWFAGLAYDYCVGFSAIDAAKQGFEATIIKAATRAINKDGSVPKIEAAFREAVVKIE